MTTHTPDYVVLVLWEGEIVAQHERGADFEHIAWRLYESTCDRYRRQDPIDGGLSVQLLQGDDVLAERFIDGP